MIVEKFKSLDSTNTKALELCSGTPQDWTVIVAEKQTAGRGRIDKSWVSLTGNLLCSFILNPHRKKEEFYQLTLVFGLAIFKALTNIAGQGFKIKYPNDILFNDKKIAGILCQSQGNKIVVGVGVNNANAPELEEIQTTSLDKINISNDELLAEIYAQAKPLYEQWNEQGITAILPDYKKASHEQGEEINISGAEGSKIKCKFYDINEQGFLLVEDSGKIQTLTNAELCF